MRTLYGVNPVKEAIAAGRHIEAAWILEGQCGRELRQLAERLERAGVAVTSASRDSLARRSETLKHQGIVARVEALPNGSLTGLIKDRPEDRLTVLVADHIQDPQNLGAIYRAADAFGVHLVFLPAHDACSHQLGSVAKASAGAVEHVSTVVVSSLKVPIAELKGHGFTVLGLEAGSGAWSAGAFEGGRLALVVGSEGGGLTEPVRALCDRLVAIPSAGKVGSLNAAVACGVALYERHRQSGR
ncbi:MAG: RNA methyltransferase [Candidatus Riflebacteria bacterium]|nr:RNA methyltransferase [Candidatus Riflebacteria bacterium]